MNEQEYFIREFNKMLKVRKVHYYVQAGLKCQNRGCLMERLITVLPVPFAQGTDRLSERVKGVKVPFYTKLNGTGIKLCKKDLRRRKTDKEGNHIKREGDFVWQKVKLPEDCVAITSKVNIHLRRESANGVEYTIPPQYQYVDYTDTKSGREYIYIIPKKHIYIWHKLTLELTGRKRSSKQEGYYMGYSIKLQNGVTVYIYVSPKRRKSKARVLQEKGGTLFEQEMETLIAYWVHRQLMFPLDLTMVDPEAVYEERENIGIELLEGTLSETSYVEYTPYFKQVEEV